MSSRPRSLDPMLAQATLPFVALDGAGMVLALNLAAARLYGRPADALIGLPFVEVVDPFSREKAALMIAEALTQGAAHDWELYHPQTDAPPLPVSYTAWRWRSEPAARFAVAAIGQPLTAAVSLAAQLAAANQQLEGALLQLERAHADLKNAQAQLVRSEKLRAMGQLVAGVAHELNTPLGFVSANLEFLAEQLPALAAASPDPDLAEDLADALAESREGLERIAGIVRDLRSFARPDSPTVQAADLNASLAATVRIARTLCPPGVTIVEDYGPLPPVVCAPGQINQVVLNLLTNAIQAIPESGTVSISTARENDRAVITIVDTGVGMDEATLARLGEPFFTTRPVGAGIGLGIAVSMGIVERHGGRLEFASTPGQGTTARLSLPLG
ncbi:MAG: ATP-binding protein [Oscillochloridaceae bacterium]|nr:ATP-binding protein [Chloroflexaceae bacterium]MDW8391083.1 ATP-binding protein [Oscillochloridaceae bacterium]